MAHILVHIIMKADLQKYDKVELLAFLLLQRVILVIFGRGALVKICYGSPVHVKLISQYP